MRIRTLIAASALVLACAAGTTLSGCRAESKMTKEEEANFKGGPMPPGYNPMAGAPGAPPAAGAPGGAPGAAPGGAPVRNAPPGPAGR